MNILVTGGLGYLGSHTILELSSISSTIHIIDNLSNSSINVFSTLQRLLPSKTLIFHQGDIQDPNFLLPIFLSNQIEAVFHFAGLKSIEKSKIFPLEYFKVNIIGTKNLLNCMKQTNIKKIIFSSSACVYKENLGILNESSEIRPCNFYGLTKVYCEKLVQEFCQNDAFGVILRYFNPIGAHSTGALGDDPIEEYRNLMANIQKVVSGSTDKLRIFGSGFDTDDGTAVRDYVHVVDIAKGHVLALEKIKNGVEIFNLGTGKGHSVLDVVKMYGRVCGKRIDYEMVGKRDGDVARVVADVKKAEVALGWKAEKNLEDMCRDSWNYVKRKLST